MTLAYNISSIPISHAMEPLLAHLLSIGLSIPSYLRNFSNSLVIILPFRYSNELHKKIRMFKLELFLCCTTFLCLVKCFAFIYFKTFLTFRAILAIESNVTGLNLYASKSSTWMTKIIDLHCCDKAWFNL